MFFFVSKLSHNNKKFIKKHLMRVFLKITAHYLFSSADIFGMIRIELHARHDKCLYGNILKLHGDISDEECSRDINN